MALAIAFAVAVTSCKTKRGPGSANVRTLSFKYPANYTFSFSGKTMPDAVITTKELAAVDKVKILTKGKEVQNVSIKFKIKISRDDIESASADNDGTELSSEVQVILRNVVAGDKITFESIKISAKGAEDVSYPPISFMVK